MEILRTLVSVPNSFKSNDLFNSETSTDSHYIFKGMICFQAAHYISFFKRIAGQSLDNQSEWTLFDDTKIVDKGGWEDVIGHCVEYSCYPTVLFFEKGVLEKHQLS